jgi:putative PIN family toxin of toxin-antitoxin system
VPGDNLLRVVLDTNVFVSGTILPGGVSTEIFQAWRQETFELLTSRAQVAELIDVLDRPKFAQRYNVGIAEIAALVRRIEASAVILNSLDPPVIELRDPDDAIILATAKTGSARFLVTGDDDLLSVRDDSRLLPLQIVRPAEFLDRLEVSKP